MRPVHTSRRRPGAALVVILLLAPAAALSQSSAGLVGAETRGEAAEHLDAADAALAAGDAASAYRHLQQARSAPTRRHGRGVASLSARSLGDALYDRFFDTRYRIFTALGREAERNGLVWQRSGRRADGPVRWDTRNAVEWYLYAMNADEIERLVTEGPAEYDLFLALASNTSDDDGNRSFSMGRIDWYTEPTWNDAPRPRELALQARFQNEVVDRYVQRIRSEAANLLAREAAAFDQPFTELEKQYSPEQWREVQEAFTGVPQEALPPPEVQRKMMRARASKPILREARKWLELLVSDDALAPVGRRADRRGGAFMEIGNDDAMPVLARSDAYDEAREYFRIGKLEAKADSAEARYMALAPDVEAYEAERRAMNDAAKARLQEQADAMQQSIEEMQKTEEEKRAFEDEADALEDELWN